MSLGTSSDSESADHGLHRIRMSVARLHRQECFPLILIYGLNQSVDIRWHIDVGKDAESQIDLSSLVLLQAWLLNVSHISDGLSVNVGHGVLPRNKEHPLAS